MAITMLEPSPEAARAGAVRDRRIVGRLAGIVQRLSRSDIVQGLRASFQRNNQVAACAPAPRDLEAVYGR